MSAVHLSITAALLVLLAGQACFASESVEITAEPASTAAAPETQQALEERVAVLEAKLAQQEEEQSAEADADAEPDAVEVETEPAISTSLYGNVYLQTRTRRTQVGTGDDENFSDVDIYWGEIGINTSYEDWSGRFSVLLDDGTETVLLNEAWAKYQRTDECGTSPWFFQVGKVLVPFGNNTYYFPTYPAVNDLGYSTLHAIGGGYDSPQRAFSAYAYNSRAELADSNNSISDYTLAWDITKRTASECEDGYELTLGYNSNLASHDLRLAGTEVESRVPAANAFGRYDFHNGSGLVHLLADYTWALDDFDPADLDANADGVGDAPAALNTELVFEPQPDTLYGVSYQSTAEFKDYAETRWGLMYGERLNKLMKLKLEYTHGDFGAFATGGQDSDDTFVGELNLSF